MESRVAALEIQVKQLMDQVGVSMPAKKTKSIKKEDEPKKKKSPTGYLLYANDTRASVKQSLIDAGTETPKPTDVIKEVAKLWKALQESERDSWNAKAKENE